MTAAHHSRPHPLVDDSGTAPQPFVGQVALPAWQGLTGFRHFGKSGVGWDWGMGVWGFGDLADGREGHTSPEVPYRVPCRGNQGRLGRLDCMVRSYRGIVSVRICMSAGLTELSASKHGLL